MTRKQYVVSPERRAATNTTPKGKTKTAQDLARDTDINIINKRFQTTGMLPAAPKEPMYGDFTEIPKDLRSMIELGRSLTQLMHNLPPQLKGLSKPEILALTPEQLREKLTPPAPPPEAKKEGTTT